MLLYPLISRLVFGLWKTLASKKSWISKVSADDQWKKQPPLEGRVIWMHCASLGEFEMGRPALELFLDRNPDWNALVTFFSPSGFEPRKNYSRAKVHYLPLDTPSEARRWQQYCNPSLAVFIRYDLWPNHLAALKKAKVPVAVIAFVAAKDPWYLKPHFPLIRRLFMRSISFWGTVREEDSARLSALGVYSEVLGNPKYDYAARTMGSEVPEHLLSWKVAQSKPILLIGSAHKGDVVWVSRVQEAQEYSIWIVPHELAEAPTLAASFEWTGKKAKYSTIDQPVDADVLVVNEFGVLSALYGIADAVVIGGGFGKATHNVLEATIKGKVAACGPNWALMPENTELVKRQYLMPGHTVEHLQSYLNSAQKGELSERGKKAQQWLLQGQGASEKIVVALEEAVEL
ncbi:MAG: hypothetical protein RL754_485 [Bacteroidota bacterium]